MGQQVHNQVNIASLLRVGTHLAFAPQADFRSLLGPSGNADFDFFFADFEALLRSPKSLAQGERNLGLLIKGRLRSGATGGIVAKVIIAKTTQRRGAVGRVATGRSPRGVTKPAGVKAP